MCSFTLRQTVNKSLLLTTLTNRDNGERGSGGEGERGKWGKGEVAERGIEEKG